MTLQGPPPPRPRAKVLTFKCEDYLDSGEAIGPVWVDGERRGGDKWVRESDARKAAETIGARFEEA